jgi:hypothetical protein
MRALITTWAQQNMAEIQTWEAHHNLALPIPLTTKSIRENIIETLTSTSVK